MKKMVMNYKCTSGQKLVKIVIFATKTQIRNTCVIEIAYILPIFNIFMQIVKLTT